ncbi:cobalamin biosynthesis protein [Streptomyces sp. TRM64462]|uniref:cobalamin biosynthesis protein n=1 Tax=Streptomyces sp. TRM64462 TaxID=2741726 RepID=UPI0015868A15|nr:cobalamin biosynthesis protein [Streptomyces sp. TRM64462]
MTLVVGVGARRGVTADEVYGLVVAVLRDAGLPLADVAALATVDTKAEEAGVVEAAARLGVPLRAYPAWELALVAVPHPSGAALAAVGTPSVAEAAALAGGGELVVPKRTSAPDAGAAGRVTCAVARGAVRLPVEGRGYTRGDAAFGLPGPCRATTVTDSRQSSPAS